MPANSWLVTSDARRSANLLLVRGERTADRGTAAAPSLPSACELEVRPALIEQAKGALMLHHGIDSHHAFAVPTPDDAGPAGRHMRLRARDERGDGGVQGRVTHADTRPCSRIHRSRRTLDD